MIRNIIRAVLIAALLIAALYFIAQACIIALSEQCQDRWEGYATVYTVQTHCLVQVGDGHWAPESNIKVTLQ